MQGIFGLERSPAEAFRIYQQASAQNYAIAFSLMASCYRHGMGVASNVEMANRMSLQAAELGDLQEMFNVALAFDQGRTRKQNHAKAFEWYHVSS